VHDNGELLPPAGPSFTPYVFGRRADLLGSIGPPPAPGGAVVARP